MGLIKSLILWIRGTSQEISEQIKEPVRDGKLAIEDAKKQLMKLRTKAVDFLATTDLLRKKHKYIEEEIKQMDEVAKFCAANGDEAALEVAVRRKMADEAQARILGETIKNNDILLEKLQNQFNIGLAKLQDAENNLLSLDARNEAAKVKQALSDASSALITTKGGLASLDNLEKSVEKAEATAKASESFQELTNIDASKNIITDVIIKKEVEKYQNAIKSKPDSCKKK